jgi:hypothetical protein
LIKVEVKYLTFLPLAPLSSLFNRLFETIDLKVYNELETMSKKNNSGLIRLVIAKNVDSLTNVEVKLSTR